MLRYVANITGSNTYWHARHQDLQSTFLTKGCVTVFIILSAADNHWKDPDRLMSPRYPDTAFRRRRAVIDNPHVVNWHFGHRVDAFMRSYFESVLDAEWHWYKFEYQDRGSIHPHGTVKLKNDPGLAEVTATAYNGVYAEVIFEKK